MEGELLCLKWRDHSSSLYRSLSLVRKKEIYCDATIACDGKFYPVHKFVLSMCSDYFEQMFEVGGQKNLLIVITGIACEELETLLDYMYFGEVNVLQSDLNTFMKAAERLRIKGLAESSEPDHTHNYGEKRTRTQCESSQEIMHKRKRSDDSLLESEHSHKSSAVQGKYGHEKTSKLCNESKTKELPVTTPLESAELGEENTTNKTSKHFVTEAQRSEVKIEPFIKPEPEDWQPVEAIEDSNVYTSEPVTPYLPPTALSVEAAGSCSVNERNCGHSQTKDFSGPVQSLPGPSRLHFAQPWDHNSPSGPVASEESIKYRGMISYGNLMCRKTGRPTSDIWNHYKTEKMDGKNFVICIYCTTQKYGYPNATKMKIHTVKCIKCPENVRKQYKDELAEIGAKSEANKFIAVQHAALAEAAAKSESNKSIAAKQIP